MTGLYVIFLRLAPSFAAHLARPGVIDAIREGASEGRPPALETLVELGLPADFAGLFVERLAYLLRLREAGVLLSAGPFADLRDGMYVCRAGDEGEARRIMMDDPLYQAGFIERDFVVRRWFAAI
jgi:uncharacterized protein YciI